MAVTRNTGNSQLSSQGERLSVLEKGSDTVQESQNIMEDTMLTVNKTVECSAQRGEK